jgi:hypothetical protein
MAFQRWVLLEWYGRQRAFQEMGTGERSGDGVAIAGHTIILLMVASSSEQPLATTMPDCRCADDSVSERTEDPDRLWTCGTRSS